METNEVEAQREFPRYESHKRVHALKLLRVEPDPVATGYVRFVPADDRYGAVAYPHGAEPVKRCKANETGDPGYLVVYPDGFTSWNPTKAFEEGYHEIGTEQEPERSFGWALERLKDGQRVRRRGWNASDQFLFLVPGSRFEVNRAPLLGIYPEGTTIDYQPHIDMRTAQGTVVPWLCSQSDALANDWELVRTPA